MRLAVTWGMMALLLPHAALAYLDPGTGSLFLQSLIAGAASLLLAVAMAWRRLVAKIRNCRERLVRKRDERE